MDFTTGERHFGTASDENTPRNTPKHAVSAPVVCRLTSRLVLGKNHRKTKIPIPFPTRDLQPVENALYYFHRGWGHTSLFGRTRVDAKITVESRIQGHDLSPPPISFSTTLAFGMRCRWNDVLKLRETAS